MAGEAQQSHPLRRHRGHAHSANRKARLHIPQIDHRGRKNSNFNNFKQSCSVCLLTEINCDSKDGIKQEVRHFQYKTWPDRKCPQVDSLYTFVQVIKANMKKEDNKGPVVVHCSAGIGRTGTFLAIDPLMDLVSQKCRVDIFERVLEMRKCRPKMVQNSVSRYYCYT